MNTEAVSEGASAQAGATAPVLSLRRHRLPLPSAESSPQRQRGADATSGAPRRWRPNGSTTCNLNAEYVNYKRRVDRDRALTQERARA